MIEFPHVLLSMDPFSCMPHVYVHRLARLVSMAAYHYVIFSAFDFRDGQTLHGHLKLICRSWHEVLFLFVFVDCFGLNTLRGSLIIIKFMEKYE